MRAFFLRLAVLLLAAACAALPAGAEGLHTRDEVRAANRLLGGAPAASPYEEMPSTSAPYACGSLKDAALDDAIAYFNFLRWLAYLDGTVALDPSLNEICQHGAVLLAALDRVDHNPDPPGDMDAEFYRIASYATGASSLAGLNWMKSDILRTGLNYFARDDGEKNLPVLGHRRWLLNPEMGVTGFGLANSQTGMTYVVMFAHDRSGEAGAWDHVCWPSAGAFPAELMRSALAWSVTLNPEVYDLTASAPAVWMREQVSGAEYSFPYPAGQYENGYFAVNEDAYGAGPCLIFRPSLAFGGLEEYQQNQVWEVRVTGLVDAAGRLTEIEYTTEMIALHAIDAAAVEVSELELALTAGETFSLTAQVIPAWADDTSVTWRSSDETVATVDATGLVGAVGAGTCEIVAASTNGHEDVCQVTVGE